MSDRYDPQHWYWVLGNGDIFSSALPGYIQATDPGYTAWLANGNTATTHAQMTDGELTDVLAKAGASVATIAAVGATSWGAVPGKDAYQAMLSIGVDVTSSGTPALSGIYGVQDPDKNALVSLQNLIASAGTWPGYYRDIANARHTMTSAQFTPLAQAILNYIEGLQDAYAACGDLGVLVQPSREVTIA